MKLPELNNAAGGEYHSLIMDICRVFNEVTGSDVDARRERASIEHFAKEHQWGRFEFRLLIEYHWNDAREREYITQPGRLNLRTIFNPSRTPRLLDLLPDLKRAKEIQEKAKQAEKSLGGDIRMNRILLRCGTIFNQKFVKIPANTPKGYRWEQPKENRIAYEQHHNRCLENYGACAWPQWKLEELQINSTWKEGEIA